MKKVAITATLGLAFCLMVPAANAQQFELPPSARAGDVLGKLARGSNYIVDDLVPNDGFLNFYTVRTNYGQLTVSGNELMLERIRELNALKALEKSNQGGAFVEGVLKSATKPIELAVDVVKAPVKTTGKVISGVFGIFDRVAKGVQNIGSNPENTVASLIGVGTAKRELAVKLGVDPYTDYKPLAKRLHQMARASALGELSVSVALGQAGTVGLVASRSITAKNLSGLIAKRTPAQLKASNRSALKKMGVRADVVERFLSNKKYTISDRTAIVLALGQLGGVKNREGFVIRAAYADQRDLAFFLRRRVEMLAYYHNRTQRFSSFVSVAGFPLNRTIDGTILIIAPLDKLVWTETGAGAYTRIAGDIKRRKLGSRVVLLITGTATKMALRNMKKLGWSVEQNAQ